MVQKKTTQFVFVQNEYLEDYLDFITEWTNSYYLLMRKELVKAKGCFSTGLLVLISLLYFSTLDISEAKSFGNPNRGKKLSVQKVS